MVPGSLSNPSYPTPLYVSTSRSVSLTKLCQFRTDGQAHAGLTNILRPCSRYRRGDGHHNARPGTDSSRRHHSGAGQKGETMYIGGGLLTIAIVIVALIVIL